MEKGFELKVLDNIGFVRYIDHMGSDERIVECARISYKSPSKGKEQDEKLINYLYKNRHTSPFESCKITFDIKMPIFVMRQYVRHRMQNLNEVSARYTELPSEFYIPKELRKQDTKNKQSSIHDENWEPYVSIHDHENTYDVYGHQDCCSLIRKHCEKTYLIYKSLIESGVAREQARMILPVNIYTEIYSTWDLHNLLHFIRLRDDSHAQSEIRDYAKAMRAITKELFPVTMKAFEDNQ